MKKNYFKSVILVIMSLTFYLSQSQNILHDGDFSLTTEIIPYDTPTPPLNTWAFWVNYYDNGSQANPIVFDGVCNFQIINPGNETWNVQLAQWGFPLNQGHLYQLSFDVKADNDRSFGVYLGEDGGNWLDLIGYDRYLYNATTEWQTITIEFEAFAIFPLHKLSFELGSNDTTTYFDNIVLIDLGVQEHSVGIIGTAVNGWDVDVDMTTTDGINYSLTNYPLNQGEAKFRQDNNWNVNWGSFAFPSGIGLQNGPNIPIPLATNYDISFNRLTGEYSFICLSDCPVSIGIIGSALTGWSDDIDMVTSDGIIYTLNDFQFSSGEAKFRQDNGWDINWGSDTFPNGVGVFNGPNIPIPEGSYTVSFNRLTGEYSFEWPGIGILGSALNGWSEDINMQSENGIIYTLDEYYFSSGEAKFRQNDSWNINWGSPAFPTGIGFYNGPNIPILEGTYSVIFNRHTGEYHFTATTCINPELLCPLDIYVENLQGMCGAFVDFPEVIPQVNCGGEITLQQTSGLPSGSFFPVGTTTNSYTLTNSSGDSVTCSFNVTVFDIEPPMIVDLNENYEPLWPANHKMVPVFIDYVVLDNCNTANTELLISSNEPENGLGDGDIAPDWEIVDEHNILLRAERSGKGNGREYYITIRTFDESWNYTERQITISVPHDNGKTIKEFNKSKRGNNKFVMYPNGADDIINIKGPISSNNQSYIIYDMFGLMKRQGNINNDQINVKTLPQGLYILKFETDDGSVIKKFIKN